MADIVGLEGDRELRIKLKDLSGVALRRALKTSLSRSIRVVEFNVKMNLTGKILKVRTGRLRASIQTQLGGSGAAPFAELGTNVIYAPVHEFGATIRAKRAKYLRFKTPDKTWHTVREVTIPPRPFMAKAFAKSLKRINRIFDEETKGLIER